MSDWIGRLASIAAIAAIGALLAGWLLGPAFASLFLFAYFVAVVAIGLRARTRLQRWLADPSPDDMPDDDGPWGEIYARLHRILREQTASRASLSHALWRFRQAGEAMPDGVLVLDADDRIEWLNPSAEDHFGLTFKRDRGQAVTNLIRSPAFVDYLAAQNYGEPLTLKGLAEADRVLSVNLVPYGNHEKLLLSRDVTRWERLESMRRDFIANVSHELRTPLTVLRGFLETLSDARDADEKVYRRSLELMTGQAERMQRLVEDLLMLSRLEDSRYPLKEEHAWTPRN
ncbi:MAG TPA: phosphate regulon sensor protein PhoR [Usitatibacteraceae bacterium]|nr:phosphate regulon sensor protein PhoR [Usitatibacteraceae bacterium]